MKIGIIRHPRNINEKKWREAQHFSLFQNGFEGIIPMKIGIIRHRRNINEKKWREAQHFSLFQNGFEGIIPMKSV
jgi:hypothetical protein